MVITSGSHTINDEGADLFDAGKLAGRAHVGSTLAGRVWRISQSLEDEKQKKKKKRESDKLSFQGNRSIFESIRATPPRGASGTLSPRLVMPRGNATPRRSPTCAANKNHRDEGKVLVGKRWAGERTLRGATIQVIPRAKCFPRPESSSQTAE